MRRAKRWTAEVKPDKRHGFRAAGMLVHARSREAAREHFALIFDVPVRWVRATEA